MFLEQSVSERTQELLDAALGFSKACAVYANALYAEGHAGASLGITGAKEQTQEADDSQNQAWLHLIATITREQT